MKKITKGYWYIVLAKSNGLCALIFKFIFCSDKKIKFRIIYNFKKITFKFLHVQILVNCLGLKKNIQKKLYRAVSISMKLSLTKKQKAELQILLKYLFIETLLDLLWTFHTSYSTNKCDIVGLNMYLGKARLMSFNMRMTNLFEKYTKGEYLPQVRSCWIGWYLRALKRTDFES